MGNEKKTVAVFGSGKIKENSDKFKLAYETGFLLAKSGFVVANGGYGGSMLASAKGAKDAGGTTIGITTDEFRGAANNEFIDREIRKPTWRERLYQLIDGADGFIVLDGGTGTLTELAVTWEMNNKSLHVKPIVVIGKQMREMIELFKRNPEVQIPEGFQLVSSPQEAITYLTKALSRA